MASVTLSFLNKCSSTMDTIDEFVEKASKVPQNQRKMFANNFEDISWTILELKDEAEISEILSSNRECISKLDSMQAKAQSFCDLIYKPQFTKPSTGELIANTLLSAACAGVMQTSKAVCAQRDAMDILRQHQAETLASLNGAMAWGIDINIEVNINFNDCGNNNGNNSANNNGNDNGNNSCNDSNNNNGDVEVDRDAAPDAREYGLWC